jgi:hypothetical protein
MKVGKSHFKHIAKMAKTLNGNMLDNTLIVYLSCSGGAHHDGQKDWPFVLVGGMLKQLYAWRKYVENSLAGADYRSAQ